MCTCDEILDLLSTQLDGELTGEEERALAEHLESCPDCRALAEDLVCIHDAMPGLNAAPPAFIKENVMKRIREEAAAPIPFPVQKKSAHRWRTWGAAAAVFAVAVLGAFALRGGMGGDFVSMMAAAPAAMPTTAPSASAESKAAPTPAPIEGAPAAGIESEDAGTTSNHADAPLQSIQRSGGQTTQNATTTAPAESVPASEPSVAPQRACLPEPSSTPEEVPMMGASLMPEATPTPEASAEGGEEPEDSSMRMFLYTAKAEPGSATAGARLYEEVFAEDYPGAAWTEGEDFTGYLLPDGDWRLEYLGQSEDLLDYLFHAYTDPTTGDYYAVPADGGEIRVCDPVPAGY